MSWTSFSKIVSQRWTFTLDCYRQSWPVIKDAPNLIFVPITIFLVSDSIIYLSDRITETAIQATQGSSAYTLHTVFFFWPLAHARQVLSELNKGFFINNIWLALLCSIIQIPLMFFLRRRLKDHNQTFNFLWVWLLIILVALPYLIKMWNFYTLNPPALPQPDGWINFKDIARFILINTLETLCILPVVTVMEAALILRAWDAVTGQPKTSDLLNEGLSRFWPLLKFNVFMLAIHFASGIGDSLKLVFPLNFSDREVFLSLIETLLFGVPFFIVIDKKGFLTSLQAQIDLLKKDGLSYAYWLFMAFVILWSFAMLESVVTALLGTETWFWPAVGYFLMILRISGAVWLYIAFLSYKKRSRVAALKQA